MATHDYVLDNATGANFRSDLNNALSAIVSNNSSSSEPSTKYAYQWWADTNEGVLKIRNSSNDGWVTLLQLDGTLTLEDGSNSAPALGFRDDLNTGIFSSAADTLDITCGGTTRGSFSSSGLTVTGNVTATTFVGNIDAVDGDFDGTLEADAITVAGTALSTVIAGTTLTQAAQTNITSLGTLTGLTLSGDMTFTGDSANIVFDKSDNQLEFADNAKAEFGTGGDLQIYHDGTSTQILNNNNQQLYISSDNALNLTSRTGQESFFRGFLNGAVELYFDNTKKFETTSGGATLTGNFTVNSSYGTSTLSHNLELSDAGRIKIGTGQDLQIYHNGSHSFIDNNTGDLNIESSNVFIKANNTENAVNCFANGAVELYHDNSKKFETLSDGVNVTGTLKVNGSALSTGGGKILQVVTTKITSQSTFNGTSFDNISGYSASITPASTSNKVLVIFNINAGSNNNGNRIKFRISRTGDDNEFVGDASGSRSRSSAMFAVSSASDCRNTTISYISTPSSTSSVTYQLQAELQVGGGSNVSFGSSATDSNSSIEGRTPQSIILMEIEG